MDRRAVIIGCDIAGLASALALHNAGFEVTIRERATGLPRSGTSLGMWPDAMAALDAIGVGARVRDETEAHTGGSIRRADGRVIAKLGTRREARIVQRPTLLRALSDEVETRLGSGAFVWGDDAQASENAYPGTVSPRTLPATRTGSPAPDRPSCRRTRSQTATSRICITSLETGTQLSRRFSLRSRRSRSTPGPCTTCLDSVASFARVWRSSVMRPTRWRRTWGAEPVSHSSTPRLSVPSSRLSATSKPVSPPTTAGVEGRASAPGWARGS